MAIEPSSHHPIEAYFHIWVQHALSIEGEEDRQLQIAFRLAAAFIGFQTGAVSAAYVEGLLATVHMPDGEEVEDAFEFNVNSPIVPSILTWEMFDMLHRAINRSWYKPAYLDDIPPHIAVGRWGDWRYGKLIWIAGDYIWRPKGENFISRAELTPEEAVEMDSLLDASPSTTKHGAFRWFMVPPSEK